MTSMPPNVGTPHVLTHNPAELKNSINRFTKVLKPKWNRQIKEVPPVSTKRDFPFQRNFNAFALAGTTCSQ